MLHLSDALHNRAPCKTALAPRLITGGAGGLGLASAKLFLSEYASVMLVDLKNNALAHLSGVNQSR
jgi:NADP-dependent 3-hydroxy acid dehydrogenase YdfG